jgi:hypothetical protein
VGLCMFVDVVQLLQKTLSQQFLYDLGGKKRVRVLTKHFLKEHSFVSDLVVL